MPHVQRLVQDLIFYGALFRCDEEIARERRSKGCEHCEGRLHQAHYPRKPRGGPASLGSEYDRRFSFCCATCRARATPASVRFLGRKVYLGAVVLLLPAAAARLTARAVALLRKALGPSARTLLRWLGWWTEVVPSTAFWTEARGRLMPPVDAAALPASLLDRFTDGDDAARVQQMLAFVSPLSTVAS